MNSTWQKGSNDGKKRIITMGTTQCESAHAHLSMSLYILSKQEQYRIGVVMICIIAHTHTYIERDKQILNKI